MGKTAILAVKILGDATSATKAMGEVEGKASKFGGALAGIGKVAGAAAIAGGAAVVALGASAVSAAGDLEQSIGAVDVVFKDSAGQMHRWAADAAQDVGLTKNEFNNLGTLIGTQLKNGGTAMDELAPKTNELIGLGSDLSAMFGGSTADAVGALSSALKGERDPIEKYGVSLKQATIDAKAAELGFEKVGGSLSNEANQAATLALIMEQTADAHGTFAREADTLQGRQARLSAELENTKAAIGMALLPAITGLLDVFNTRFMPIITKAGDVIVGFLEGLNFGALFGSLGGAVSDVSGRFSVLAPLIEGVAAWFTGALLPAVASVVSWFTGTLAPALSGLAANLFTYLGAAGKIVGDFVAGMTARLAPIMPTVLNIFSTVGEIITTAVQLAAVVVGHATEAIKAAWTVVGPPIMNTVAVIFKTIVGIIGPVMDTIKGIIRTVLAVVKGDWSGAWNGVKATASGVWAAIKAVISGAINVVKSVISSGLSIVKSVFSSAWDSIKSATSAGVSNVVSWFRGLPSKIVGALSGLAGRMGTIGRQIITGLINGVKGAAGRLVSSVKGVIGDAISGAKRLLGIASPSKVFANLGHWTGLGFAEGIAGEARRVDRAGAKMVNAAIPSRLPTIDPIAGRRGSAAGSPAPVVININGAIDPGAVARQVRDLLNGDARRRGVVPITGQVLP